MTEDEARVLISRLLGSGNPIEMYPFEFGWLVQEDLSTQERQDGMHIGQGSFIVDLTGVVTAQPSLPAMLVVEEYVTQRRLGRISGRQVWPVTGSQAE